VVDKSSTGIPLKDEIIYGLNPVIEALCGKRAAFELFFCRDR
jgi:hypothetical protein